MTEPILLVPLTIVFTVSVGREWNYIASGMSINIDYLCPDRRQSYETGDHELLPICYVCVDSNDDRELMAEYKKIYRRVTKSGSHGTFDDVMTESNAIPAMKYLHSYLAQNRNIFNTCLGLLPRDTFCKSTSGPPPLVRQDDAVESVQAKRKAVVVETTQGAMGGVTAGRMPRVYMLQS
jgi:hypothetical protein